MTRNEIDLVIALYQTHCPNLPQPRLLNGQRLGWLRGRWADAQLMNPENPVEIFEELFRKAGESRFLNGDSQRGWQADFSWLIRPNNFLKVLEGNYENND